MVSIVTIMINKIIIICTGDQLVAHPGCRPDDRAVRKARESEMSAYPAASIDQ